LIKDRYLNKSERDVRQARRVRKSIRQKKELSFEQYIEKCRKASLAKIFYIDLKYRGKGMR